MRNVINDAQDQKQNNVYNMKNNLIENDKKHRKINEKGHHKKYLQQKDVPHNNILSMINDIIRNIIKYTIKDRIHYKSNQKYEDIHHENKE